MNHPILTLPEPFKSIYTDETRSTIDPPDASNIVLHHASTVIIIQEGNVLVYIHICMYVLV